MSRREHVEVVIENFDRPVFRGFDNEEAARVWIGAHLNFIETGEFEVGPGQTAPILVDLNPHPQGQAPPATPANHPAPAAPPAPATHPAPTAPATPTAHRNANQPSTPGMPRPPPRGPYGGGGIFGVQATQPGRCAPLSGLSGFGAALPDITLAADGSSSHAFKDNPETPSPSKGKGRSYVNTERRTLAGQVVETTHAQFTRAILNSLARQIRGLQRDAITDLVHLYLSTNYTAEAAQEIRDTLDEDLPMDIMLDRLVRGGMPIREAFLSSHFSNLLATI
jgi:hypothetical protein